MSDMKTYDETLETLRAKIPEEQYIGVMYQPYCELSPGFLGFIQPYEIISEMLPKDWKVIDLGCGAAAQCFFFTEHAGYTGVDVLYDREADPEDIMAGRYDSTLRFESGNTTHYEKDIESFIDENPEAFDDGKTLAVCVHVPDEEAVWTAEEKLDNILVYDPEKPVFFKAGLDEEIRQGIAERLEELRKTTV